MTNINGYVCLQHRADVNNLVNNDIDTDGDGKTQITEAAAFLKREGLTGNLTNQQISDGLTNAFGFCPGDSGHDNSLSNKDMAEKLYLYAKTAGNGDGELTSNEVKGLLMGKENEAKSYVEGSLANKTEQDEIKNLNAVMAKKLSKSPKKEIDCYLKDRKFRERYVGVDSGTLLSSLDSKRIFAPYINKLTDKEFTKRTGVPAKQRSEAMKHAYHLSMLDENSEPMWSTRFGDALKAQGFHSGNRDGYLNNDEMLDMILSFIPEKYRTEER